MNLKEDVQPSSAVVKIICEKCAKVVEELIHEKDPILFRDRFLVRCHGAQEVLYKNDLVDRIMLGELYAFGGE